MSDVIDMTNVNLASENLGAMWDDFVTRCIPEAAILLQDAYNLINLSFPDNSLDTTITTILIDEAMGTSDTIQAIRRQLIYGLVDCLQIMGIIIDMDYVGPEELVDLSHVLDTIYTFDGMEDLLGLVDVLEDDQIDPKERFITVIQLNDPSYDTEKLQYIIKDVSPNVTKGIMVGLNILDRDDNQYMEPSLKRRIIDNKEFLSGTVGETHIKNGGGLQQELDGYLGLFGPELGPMMIEDPVLYIKNILSLMLISSIPETLIKGQILSLAQEICGDLNDLYKAQAVIDGVKINE